MAVPTKQPVPSISNTIRDGINLFDELADVIANPPPDKPLRKAISQSGRLMCDFYGATPFAARALFGTSSPVIATLCQPYYDGQGYDGPVPSAPSFTGGQCAGIAYLVQVIRAGSIIDFSNTLNGPIGAFTYTRSGAPNFRLVISVTHAGGTATSDVGDPGDAAIATYVQSAARVDALPDTCGNIPTPAEPGANPPPDPGPFPPGYGPGVDPDGQPYFYVPPIDPEFPGDEPVEVPVFGPSGEPPPGPPPGPGEPATPIDTGVGDEAADEAPEGKMLWALKVDILTIASSPREYAPGVYRGVCYVYMGDNAGLDHDPAGAMLRSGQLILAERDYLTKWRVKANTGYDLRVTPYYKSNGE